MVRVSKVILAKIILALPIVAGVLGSATAAYATPDMALTLRAGTPGVGLDYDISIVNRVSARIGYSGFTYNRSVDETDASYDGKFKMSQLFGVFDWYVFNGGFRISAGAVNSRTIVDLTGRPTGNGTYTIGDHDYPASDIAAVQGRIKIGEGLSPYVGIGWGNPVDKQDRWTFMFDLGAIHAGEPKVDSLTATCSAAIRNTPTCAQIQNDVQVEINDFKDDTSKYSWYPVISFGLAYRF